MEKSVKYLVVDTGPFIRNIDLQSMTDFVYTIQEVVDEIKDKDTRRRLNVLPYEIIFREPSAEAIKEVTDFTKLTGDYATLSAVDIKLMALSLLLEHEHVGKDHINKEPRKDSWFRGRPADSTHIHTPGFHMPDKSNNDVDFSKSESNVKKVELESTMVEEIETTTENLKDVHLDEKYQEDDEFEDGVVEVKSGDSSFDEDYDSDEDGGDWITPGNVKEAKHKLLEQGGHIKGHVAVATVTTDFAMQNVLIQMGLKVISLNGFVIKNVKSFVLRCGACLKVTKDSTRVFCPFCGNKALKRLSAEIAPDGSVRYFLSKRFQHTTRGLKFPLPRPKGGKHAVNPMLVEDQPIPKQHPSNLARIKMDIMNADYVTHMSPFAVNDINSRAAMLGIRSTKNGHVQGCGDYWNRKNPNAPKKHYGNRK